MTSGISRRHFLKGTLAGSLAVASGMSLGGCHHARQQAPVFVGKIDGYDKEIASVILAGMLELGISRQEIKGKKILLKPNMVEPCKGKIHVTTHPLVVRGAIEAFLRLGAAEVMVAEGPGFCRDTHMVLEETGLGEILHEDRIPFTDLNYDPVYAVQNSGRLSRISTLVFPATLRRADWIVSMPKLKTHWVGVSLSLKNMFGVMPGCYYGWPKNLLHREGPEKMILDINETLKPHFAIVDGITGMEGDGPLTGTPRHAGVIVMGRNLVAVDATCTRIMAIQPGQVPYLALASEKLGPINEAGIIQRGETIVSVRQAFVQHILYTRDPAKI
ncbi:MAG: DUF362 domain-containing protein [Geobacter sp.]|nr:DUF362 domain-containing protein [Geobacter sp.]